MAVLAASIADTVAGMQRVLTRKEYSSDSDEPYLRPPNHSNKLKRKASHISDGWSASLNGSKGFRKTVKHAGYTRDIIRRNPRRYDEDGDELATEDEDEEADARAAEENPYADIRLEKLLAPLTSAATLPEHPSMSHSYLSSTLSDMVQHACEMTQRERKTLSDAKKMMTKLRGDNTWIPTGKMETSYDDKIFDTSKVYDMIIASAPDNSTSQKARNGHTKKAMNEDPPAPEQGLGIRIDDTTEPGLQNSERSFIENITSDSAVKARSELAASPISGKNDEASSKSAGAANLPIKAEGVERVDQPLKDVEIEGKTPASKEIDFPVEVSSTQPRQTQQHSPTTAEVNNILQSVENKQADDREVLAEGFSRQEDGDKDANKGSLSPPRRVTRAQAQADKIMATSRSESPEDWVPPPIHPLFLIPPSTKPDPDFGLPMTEAQETRSLLTAYVQKQEEVCRGAEKLYEGLLLADRQRKTVLKWCKAEGHVGEMSDGEDWYDKEEWGIEDDLRKGHAEEEEDTVIQGKKTRGRRA